MMYKDQLAVAIKHNGKILRETKDLVKLPFGSEFSVLVKNLNSRRVKFTLHIDGTDALDGEEIIVNANSEVEMKRFIRNGNMDEGNAFKFIERTAAIEDGPRGIKVDDGVVRVEFWFEQEAPIVTITYHRDVWWDEYYRTYRHPIYWGQAHYGPVYNVTNTISGSSGGGHASGGLSSAEISNIKLGAFRSADVTKGMTSSATSGQNSAQAVNNVFTSNASLGGASASASTFATPTMDSYTPEAKMEVDVNEAGITVPGSKVDQKFTPVYGFKSEAVSHVIILRIVGMVGTVEVVTPVTVKAKQKCTTCGHVNKHNAKFCSECGTALELL